MADPLHNLKHDEITHNTDMSETRLRNLAELTHSWIRPDLHQAIAMQVARHGRTVFEKAIGSLNPDSDSQPIQQDTIFPVASLSKVFTATAIMTLVEDGLISTHNAVQDYISGFSGVDKEKVRLWNLLTHTIGGHSMEEMDNLLSRMADTISNPPLSPDNQHPKIHEFLNLGYDVPLSREPGAVVIYSNYGFELLGEIVRIVSGLPLATYFEERICKPLGMLDTHFILPEEKENRVVRRPPSAAYADAKDIFCKGIGVESEFRIPWASAGAFSTTQDLTRFGQMFLNSGKHNGEQILSKSTVDYMTRNQTYGLGDGDRDESLLDGSRGIGWDIPGTKRDLMYANLYSPNTYCHSGAGGSLLWIDPTNDIVGVFLSIELTVRSDGQRSWAGDRFANAITAAVIS
jgi:serine-type D-Ala-D-Ala carboxypeptidase